MNERLARQLKFIAATDATNRNRSIAAALGHKLWTTDSFVPRYRESMCGPWRIEGGGMLAHDCGYYSGLSVFEMPPFLARRSASEGSVEGEGWEMWMSLTPHETESQSLGNRYARGTTAIMGLGMGWIAANAALNPKVNRVLIAERDTDVIRLFQESGAYESIPASARRKMAIVNADALQWRPDAGQNIDFLFADIWLHLAEPQAFGQILQMQRNVQASQLYFWGQELAVHSAAALVSDDTGPLTGRRIRRAIADVIRLPLVIPDHHDYGRMIEQVIYNRIRRQLPIQFNIA